MAWIQTPVRLPGSKKTEIEDRPSREIQSLSSRLAHCDSFAWTEGMLAAEVPLGERWPTGQLIRQKGWEVENRIGDGYEMLPVIEDPATRGCLLDLVRRRGYPHAHCMPQDGSWVVLAPYSDREILARGEFEGEAISLALLAVDAIAKLREGVANEKG